MSTWRICRQAIMWFKSAGNNTQSPGQPRGPALSLGFAERPGDSNPKSL
jgi:hypothetical protein